MKSPRIYSLLGINIRPQEKNNILENILKYTQNQSSFTHVVSINPEIILEARQNREFKRVIETAQINIIDGSWALLALQSIYKEKFERVTGVDLMSDLLDLAGRAGLTVGLIGASGTLAEEIAICYQEKYPKSSFFGLQGFKAISQPKKEEIDAIFSIITARRPHILFFAFGSPAQELWIDANKTKLEGIVCMGVGGAFDFISGKVERAPAWMRAIYLEWLYRLVKEPWRVKRQMKLAKYLVLVVLQAIRQARRQ